MLRLRRRAFITTLGVSAIWPLAVRAQRAMPVIGFLHLTSLEATRDYLSSFQQGLREAGYAEGGNVAFEYRWAEGRNDRLSELVGELVQRQVSVIVVLETTTGALAAKSATQTIPIVFMQGSDPVEIGLVQSLSHPGKNVTGINLFLEEVAAKRLGLLLELLPAAKLIGYLRNPTNPVFAATETKQVMAAARDHGVELLFANGTNLSEIETSFADLVRQRVDAIFVSSDGFLLTHSDQVIALASRHALPAIYGRREAVEIGGLMSYGANFRDAWRQAGVYAGRILKGEKAAELPVQQVTKIELCINFKTVTALGLILPLSLLGRADEVVE